MVDGMICGYQAGGFRRQEDTVCAGAYKGKAEWWVTRGNTVLRVRAPSPQAAIKAALEHWGLEPALLQQWQADLLREVNPDRMYTAYDTKDDLEPLIEMGKKLRLAGFSMARQSMRCYVLCGYDGDTFEGAEKRMIQTMQAGFVPFAMLFRDESGKYELEWKRFQREWCKPIIVGKKFNDFWRDSE